MKPRLNSSKDTYPDDVIVSKFKKFPVLNRIAESLVPAGLEWLILLKYTDCRFYSLRAEFLSMEVKKYILGKSVSSASSRQDPGGVIVLKDKDKAVKTNDAHVLHKSLLAFVEQVAHEEWQY